MTKPTEKVDLVIVGAGLVGSLLSIYLARRGLKVQVFERRQDIRTLGKAEGRSINLAISRRGLNALEKLGLESAVLREAVPMKGRMMHAVSGALTFQRYGLDDTQCINSISRAGLNRFLLQKADEAGVALHFHKKLTGARLDEGYLEFLDEKSGDVHRLQAGHIFGTDGSSSVLRHALQEAPNYEFNEIDPHTAYKELAILDDHGRHKMEKNALHIWPRGQFMLIALPNYDGSFTCTLFLPTQGEVSFAALRTPTDVQHFFEEWFPDSLGLLDRLTPTFFENPTGSLSMIKCFPWTSPRKNAVILGDAAHAIIPFFGQGMNCGFEDVVALDRLIGEQKTPQWEEIFALFERDRKPRADAVADLSSENFIEMRDLVGNPRFLLQKLVEKILEERFPQYVSRYSMVSFSLIPYDTAYRIGEEQKKILHELCKDINRPEELDLNRAGQLVNEKIVPLMKASR